MLQVIDIMSTLLQTALCVQKAQGAVYRFFMVLQKLNYHKSVHCQIERVIYTCILDRRSSRIYDIIILIYHTFMTTLSVPLTPKLEAFINSQVKSGKAANKAHVVRYALQRLSEEEAVEAVLQSEREVSEGKILRGNLRALAKRIK